MNLMTALEMYNHPGDLYFGIVRGIVDHNKWGILITRGPGHHFKLLVTSEPVFESALDAANDLKDLLDQIQSIAEGSLKNPSDSSSGLIVAICSGRQPRTELNCLSKTLIDRIMQDVVREPDYCAMTYKYGLWPA